MKNIYLLLLIFCLSFSIQLVTAQIETTNSEESEKIPVTQRDYENTEVQMADTFREDGKIYVVVAVLTTIFAGIVLFLALTEIKLKKLEDLVFSERRSKDKI